MRTILIYASALVALALAPASADAQESPARRLANIVGVAVDEYQKGVDAAGLIVLQLEYDEAVAFLNDARDVAARVTDDRAPKLVALVIELQKAVARRARPEQLLATRDALITLLGPDASLDFPTEPIDLTEGRAIYQQRCASCHGDAGRGDGFAAVGMLPVPAKLADHELMADVTPAIMYRVVSVGIPGTSMAGAADLTPAQRWAVVTYVTTLRAADGDAARGRAILTARCTGCANGAVPAGHSIAWLADRHDKQLLAALAAGDPLLGLDATMPVRDADARAVVAALRAEPRIVADVARSPRVVAADVLAMVDRSIASAQAGDATGAGDLAFDAYVAFEPLESTVRTRDPALVALLERHFADLKGAVKRGDLNTAVRSRALIANGLPQVVERAERPESALSAFFESLLIILREGFEAILILGAVIAFLVRTGNQARVREVWYGVGAGVAASAVLAILLRTVLANAPASREVIEGATMLVAVGVLFWVSYWLLTKVEVAAWTKFIREQVGSAITSGRGTALAVVAFLAVFREGAETALFYQALLARGPQTLSPMLAGLALGTVVLVGLWFGIQHLGVRIPLRTFFGTTSGLLYLLAFIFMGKGIRELQEGNVLSITPIDGAPYFGPLGIFPSAETLVGQGILVVFALVALWVTLMPRRMVAVVPPAPSVPAPSAPASAAPTPRSL